MRVYCDQGVDKNAISDLAAEFNLELVHVDHYEQRLKYADSIPGVFVLDKSNLNGGDYLADGNDIDKIKPLLLTGKPSDTFDVAHIYSAYHANCDVFLTQNPKDFIRLVRKDPSSNEKRELLENILKGMRIYTLDEFLKLLHAK